MRTLGELLKRYRELKLLTQQEMADLIGITRVTYIKIENDKSKNVSCATLKKISAVLDKDIERISRIYMKGKN